MNKENLLHKANFHLIPTSRQAFKILSPDSYRDAVL
jgi:hypothetical protein